MQTKNLRLLLDDQPSYRKKQINKLIWHDFIDSWEKATNLPETLRKKLEKHCSLEIKAKISQSPGADKALIELNDKNKIETVLIKTKKRNTVCLSSQAGCALGCSFCATGKMGFKRNLTTKEILLQVLFWSRVLKKQNQKVNNLVFMGMGEPFLNYKNTLQAVRFINQPEYFNIGARKISISTCGIVPGIEKLAKEDLQINLAVSLHAPNNKLRNKLMPINKKYPLEKLFQVTDNYIKITNRKVMLEYLLLNKVNDQTKHAEQLAKLIKNKKLYMVNLVEYNATGQYEKSPNLDKFKKILQDKGLETAERKSPGENIQAACGQLVVKKDK